MLFNKLLMSLGIECVVQKYDKNSNTQRHKFMPRIEVRRSIKNDFEQLFLLVQQNDLTQVCSILIQLPRLLENYHTL